MPYRPPLDALLGKELMFTELCCPIGPPGKIPQDSKGLEFWQGLAVPCSGCGYGPECVYGTAGYTVTLFF